MYICSSREIVFRWTADTLLYSNSGLSLIWIRISIHVNVLFWYSCNICYWTFKTDLFSVIFYIFFCYNFLHSDINIHDELFSCISIICNALISNLKGCTLSVMAVLSSTSDANALHVAIIDHLLFVFLIEYKHVWYQRFQKDQRL